MSARGPDVSASERMPPDICAGKTADGSQSIISNSLVIARFSLPIGSAGHLVSVPRCLVAQDIRQEGHQSSQRGDVSDPPGRDVLDPTDHAPRRPCARVEVQHERPVGR
jgi:hypothetical protein